MQVGKEQGIISFGIVIQDMDKVLFMNSFCISSYFVGSPDIQIAFTRRRSNVAVIRGHEGVVVEGISNTEVGPTTGNNNTTFNGQERGGRVEWMDNCSAIAIVVTLDWIDKSIAGI